jgi:hypothetical protein
MPAIGGGAGKSAQGERRARRRPSRPRPRPAPRPRARPVYRPPPRPQGPYSHRRAPSHARTAPRPSHPRAPRPRYSPRHRAPAFGPISRQPNFGVQRTHQARKTRKALSKLPAHPAIPRFPVLPPSYTTRQRTIIQHAYRTGARRAAAVRSINELYLLGNLQQRHNMRAGRARCRLEPADASRGSPQRPGSRGARDAASGGGGPDPVVVREHGAQHVRVPNSGNLGRGVGHFLRPLTLPYELGRATVESPGAVAKSSLRTGVESITGIPQAAKQIVSDVQQHGLAKGVGHSLAAIAKDYERRYGPILTDPARFRQQVKSDYGLTPFVFDASVLGGGAGRVAGALARSGPAGRAAAALTRLADRHPSAARPAAAARLLHGASKGERPALRYSAGERGVRSQEVSRNLFKAVGQRGLDRSRRRAFEKQAGRAGVRVDRRTNRLIGTETGGGRFTALRPGPGEVVPKTTGVAGRSLRALPGLEKFTGRAPREIGGRQSVTRAELLPARAAALEKINRRIEKLSPEEGNALKYMLQLGVKPDEAGLRQLTRRLAQMQEAGRARASSGSRRCSPTRTTRLGCSGRSPKSRSVT